MNPEVTRTLTVDKGSFGITKEQFKQVTDSIWTSKIRPSLIFNKDLHLCRGCISFFSKDDIPNDHPSDQTCQVSHYCILKNINNEQSFFYALWCESVALLPVYGQVLIPGFTNKHVQPPATKLEASFDNQLQCPQLKAVVLEQEVLRLTDTVKKLSHENHVFKQENESLLSQVVHIKNQQEEIQWRAKSHLQALQRYLTPDFVQDEP